MAKPYTRKDDPKRAAAVRMHAAGVSADEVAAQLQVSAGTVFRWVRDAARTAEPPVAKARRLLGELADTVADLADARSVRARARAQAPGELRK